LEWQFI